MTRLLLAATALTFAFASAPHAAQATTCTPAGCVCDGPCTDCGYDGRGVCVWINRPLVGCYHDPNFCV